jgi:hypothetical protein
MVDVERYTFYSFMPLVTPSYIILPLYPLINYFSTDTLSACAQTLWLLTLPPYAVVIRFTSCVDVFYRSPMPFLIRR